MACDSVKHLISARANRGDVNSLVHTRTLHAVTRSKEARYNAATVRVNAWDRDPIHSVMPRLCLYILSPLEESGPGNGLRTHVPHGIGMLPPMQMGRFGEGRSWAGNQ